VLFVHRGISDLTEVSVGVARADGRRACRRCVLSPVVSGHCPPQRRVPLVAGPRFEPSNGDQLVEAVRGLSHPDVPPFARICKTFRNRRPRSASTGSQAGEPTPIVRGRLRCAVIASCLSRRRPRVRVPSTPPFPSFVASDEQVEWLIVGRIKSSAVESAVR
jgi:hypothetical protein